MPYKFDLNSIRSHLDGDFFTQKRKIIIGVLAGLTLIILGIIAYELVESKQLKHEYLGFYEGSSPTGQFKKAAVITDAPHCAQYGKQVLKRGGSAVDAAISTLLCMGVVIPESTGIGGGCFFVFYNKTAREATVIDGREWAGERSYEDMFKGNTTLADKYGLSIAVPGELAAYEEAHKRFGKRPWAELFDGAIDIATNGFPVHEHLETTIKQTWGKIVGTKLEKLLTNPKTKQMYRIGEWMLRPDLVATFRNLAANGSKEFYRGEMTKKLVKEIQESGGILTLKDFEEYKPNVYPALKVHLSHNLGMFSVRPPGSGAILSFILNVISNLKGFDSSAGENEKDAILYYHRLIEVFKHAYAKRFRLEDEAFNEDVKNLVNNLTSIPYAKEVSKLINDVITFPPNYYTSAEPLPEDHGTASVSVIDSEGNVASVGTTVNAYYGSKVLSESGIIFNNEMDDFSLPGIINGFNLPPSKLNRIRPKKRPVSSMCPTIIVDESTDEMKLVIGGAGGTMITTTSALVIIRHLFVGDSLRDSIGAPRIHHQLFPNQIVHEPNFPKGILNGLRSKGHNVTLIRGRGAVITAISRDRHGNIATNYDHRKGGSYGGF